MENESNNNLRLPFSPSIEWRTDQTTTVVKKSERIDSPLRCIYSHDEHKRFIVLMYSWSLRRKEIDSKSSCMVLSAVLRWPRCLKATEKRNGRKQEKKGRLTGLWRMNKCRDVKK